MRISVTLEGEKQLSRKFRDLPDDLGNARPAFRKVAYNLTNVFEDDVFDTDGGAIGVTWSPLSRAYAQRKAQKYPGQGILEATGEMRDSFRNKYSNNRAEIYNVSPYFKYHQSSAPRSSDLPRRVMMRLTNPLKEEVMKTFHEFVKRELRQ